MKRVLVLVAVICISNYGHSQTLVEWTNQKKTQIKYLVQQIAALQVYIGYVKKGYEIADKGLQTISNIKNGDFNLHRDFFGSLKAINPRIKNYAKVADITLLQIRIVQNYQKSYRRIKHSGQFTNSEIEHIYKVFSRLLDDTADNIEQLTKLITANQYDMKDDERLRRIDELYTDMKDKDGMIRQFSHENMVLAVQRMKEQNDADMMRKVYAIPD
ncbi:MAG: hypothetical protein J0I32_04655 [Sphingobacteriales bacterium]|nr:hypothetical protein [Sphingobacteriales bacterium]OJV98451.1 MAG: hypothetical protein BGO52_11730 [Sphingobacteriales bacterium 44-61]